MKEILYKNKTVVDLESNEVTENKIYATKIGEKEYKFVDIQDIYFLTRVNDRWCFNNLQGFACGFGTYSHRDAIQERLTGVDCGLEASKVFQFDSISEALEYFKQ